MVNTLRLKAILGIAYLWATVIGYMNAIFKSSLIFLMQNCSDKMTPVVGNRKHPFKILMAGMEDNKIITNKVRLFLKNKWEKDYCNGNGGANLHELGEMLGASFLWISYMMSDDEILRLGKTLNEETNKIYSVAVNLKTNVIQKFYREISALEMIPIENAEILFRQTPLQCSR